MAHSSSASGADTVDFLLSFLSCVHACAFDFPVKLFLDLI